MKLSMHILADWLAPYHPTVSIVDGEQVLRGVRLFSQELMTRGYNQNVYIGRTKEFIDSSTPNNIICVHGRDMILLDTDDLEEVMNFVFSAFDFYFGWADNLLDGIEAGMTLQQILDDSFCVFQDPLSVYDTSFVSVGYSSQFSKGSVSADWDNIIDTGSHRLSSILDFKDYFLQRRGIRHAEKAYLDTLTIKNGYWTNLYVKQKHCGVLFVIAKNHPATPGRLQLCDTLASIIQRWIAHHQDSVQMPSETEWITQLLDGDLNEYDKILRYFELSGWKKDDQKTIIQISVPENLSDIGIPFINMLRRALPHCFILNYQNMIVLLADTTIYPFPYLLQTLRPLLKESRAFAATSYPFTDIRQAKMHYEQCALITTFSSHQPGNIYHCKDFALDYIHDILKIHVNKNMVHPALSVLRNHDRKNHGDLYQTLYVYLIHERNLTQTAKLLKIHRNTLLYRLEKISDLTGLQLDLPEIREYLILSYRLMES